MENSSLSSELQKLIEAIKISELLLDFLSFSASSFSSMARYSVVTDKESIEVVEEFILEQLNLTKGTISEIKVAISDMEMKTLRFLVTVIYGYRNSMDKLI
ncbi:hypothetical protein ES332_D10G273900v1 [Gossypium tomentosum]|uniref:Uncharacterized protein n=1 Tax=Gossypium tomentosum TaxID=34277 RepID=A0A5D2JBL0_GOSTO|nr:hypothetical protein ES332_D10G273900v1 [Gossypium tomentosum]